MPRHVVDLKNKKRYFIISKQQQDAIEESDAELDGQTPLYYVNWEAPEYLHFEKTRNWTLTLFAIGLAFLILAVTVGSYTGATLALLVTFVVYLFGHRAPRYLNYKITPLGIEADGRVFLFDELASFWIIYHPPVKELILRSKKAFMPLVHIQLEYADPNKIRDILLEFLPEKEEEEPLSHIIAHVLKF